MWETGEANTLDSSPRHTFRIGPAIILNKVHRTIMEVPVLCGGQSGLRKCGTNLIVALLVRPLWLPTAHCGKGKTGSSARPAFLVPIYHVLSNPPVKGIISFCGNTPTLSHLRLCAVPPHCSLLGTESCLVPPQFLRGSSNHPHLCDSFGDKEVSKGKGGHQAGALV